VLFKFSETFGHPSSDEEKNVTKEVYDRYLSIKRLIRKNSANVSHTLLLLLLLLLRTATGPTSRPVPWNG
jgi:hypothetical protein